MRSGLRFALLAAVFFLAWRYWPAPTDIASLPAGSSPQADRATIAATTQRYPAFLPPEAIATLEAIERGGPFTYDRDGSVFENRERQLPVHPRAYYREYTVDTPGVRNRGARRIVTGGNPPEVFFYTDDHYRSFRSFEGGS